MRLNATELVDAHALVSPLGELIDRRRATYEIAVELATGPDPTPDLDPTMIDNPMLRGHLAEVLGGKRAIDITQLTSIETAVGESGRWDVGQIPVRIASTPSAGTRLAAALRRVTAELRRHGEGDIDEHLVDERSPVFQPATRVLRGGVELAFSVVPDLMADLMPHVMLIAMVHRDRAGQLGSASAREYPGLIVLPTPLTALEAAEALVHEGAHQKFFDLAIVGSVFSDNYTQSPLFRPPWAPATSHPWPLEQTIAAFHAYSCLAAFWAKCVEHDIGTLHSTSLLPRAAERARTLGGWIADRSEFLGHDGREFIKGLVGKPIRGGRPNALIDPEEVLARAATAGEPFAVRQCGGWRLVVRWSRPPEIIWLRS